MTELQPSRDSNQSNERFAEPVPAASSLGTDDEAGGASSICDRVAEAKEAEKRIGNAPKRHRKSL